MIDRPKERFALRGPDGHYRGDDGVRVHLLAQAKLFGGGEAVWLRQRDEEIVEIVTKRVEEL